ncbi:hypothetical protein ACHAWU_009619 [Discostella pseudostelligera]|uniref:Orc1-like AAA ATPase domain-containing protein n=1 Tax=Discostella pseudostelligera TaxID=259834 RepID=A0ABD3MA16_9STRA
MHPRLLPYCYCLWYHTIILSPRSRYRTPMRRRRRRDKTNRCGICLYHILSIPSPHGHGGTSLFNEVQHFVHESDGGSMAKAAEMTSFRFCDMNVPLRTWVQDETHRLASKQQTSNCPDQISLLKNQVLIRQITVALCAAELMRHASRMSRHSNNKSAPSDSSLSPSNQCSIDNFVVHVSRKCQADGTSTRPARWNNIEGVSMIHPVFSAQLLEPFYLMDSDGNAQGTTGRYVEVDIYPPLPSDSTVADNADADDEESVFDGRNECHLFGILMYEICAGTRPSQLICADTTNSHDEPQRKRSTAVRYDKRKGKSYSTSLNATSYAPLQELGFPSSISTLVQSLIEGHDTYMSLDAVCGDIQLLLNDPDCFLFDMERLVAQGGSIQPQVKSGKLYGREEEVTLVTDAFCRVSSGMNEALFIGGYSGCGKSMLVQSLKARIDIAGGYVLTQKCDEVSKERPLLDVLHAFDKLCLLIMLKSSPQTLMDISNELVKVFSSDFSVLARLLPNINVVFPKLAKPTEDADGARNLQGMNLNNVCYTLQRFMRIVSSTVTPVMLFLDDLQWAGNTSLELINAILSDKRGSSCFLFVGCYRDNEVQEGHPIFHLMSSLDSSGVKSTNLQLSGLSRNCLNLMISESLGILPHLCGSLGNIIYEKTGGNPYFALEFLRSLVDRRLLKYSLRERRWIWDESKIRSENITDNVLHLLAAKMASLPEDIQSALRIVSCFGIKIDQNIVDYLCLDPQFTHFSDRLFKSVDESFVRKIDTGFKFIHDKVREAAYSLIPEGAKSQFHYELGMLLFSISKRQGTNDATFLIVDQINHGVPSLVQPEGAVEIAELNLKAGVRAMEFSDYLTASSYLSKAMSLLPTSHWQDHYELSLRLYFLSAKAAYSCSTDNIQHTRTLLKAILENGRSIGDKLDAYHLHVTILYNQGEPEAAYFTCCQVLRELNETIPDTIGSQELTSMVGETGKLLENVSGDELVEMKAMNSVRSLTLKFLSVLLNVTYFRSPDTTFYLGCKMVGLTLKHGVCDESVYSFIQYASITCQRCRDLSKMQEACRIGKVAMSLLRRFNSPELVPKTFACYYGFIAVHSEPLHVCVDCLRRGFDVGISGAGAINFAFFNSVFLVRNALLSGENLLCLRKEVDYHLDIMARFKHTVFRDPVLAYRETISKLIDKAQSPTMNEHRNSENSTFDSMNTQRSNVIMFLNIVLQSFWLGHSDRCEHYAKRALNLRLLGSQNWLVLLFYAALNAFRVYRKGKRGATQLANLRLNCADALNKMRPFAALSPSNYNGKVLLLESEMHSLEAEDEEAQSSYTAAISASANMCDRACFGSGHYTRINQPEIALEFFRQAKDCYAQWGSEMKVEFITKQMSLLKPSLTTFEVADSEFCHSSPKGPSFLSA